MKKIILITIIAFCNTAFAQQIEVVSPRQAEDILTYRAATTAADVIGKWKKVLHGPSESKMGQYIPQGIAEGAKQKTLTLTIGVSDLSNWLPQDVSTVYTAYFQDFLTPAVEHPQIIKAPVMDQLDAMSIKQIGNGITFGFKSSYKYKTVRNRARSATVIPGLIFTIDYNERVEEDKWIFVEIKYICGLQLESKDRLVCEQNRGRGYREDEGHASAVSSQLDFPKVIAFERVK